MTEPLIAFVAGNSWQLNYLSDRQRQELDRAQWVFCCNDAALHWRQVGFRPTVYVYGDTHTRELREELRNVLETILRTDEKLKQRLALVFLGHANAQERKEILRLVRDLPTKDGPPILHYQRYSHMEWKVDQPIARRLAEKIYHHSSTLTDLVNLAYILAPGHEIRVLGCQLGDDSRHYYNADYTYLEKSRMADFTRRIHVALAAMRKQGVPVVDSNLWHGFAIDEQIPRVPLIGD